MPAHGIWHALPEDLAWHATSVAPSRGAASWCSSFTSFTTGGPKAEKAPKVEESSETLQASASTGGPKVEKEAPKVEESSETQQASASTGGPKVEKEAPKEEESSETPQTSARKVPKSQEDQAPPCPKWTGQMCEGKSVKKCTRGNSKELQCVDNRCMCKDKTCYVEGQCVADGCHVAAAQVAAIQSAGGINSPLAQEAALRAGRKLDELSLNQNQGDGNEDPQAARGKKPLSAGAQGTAAGEAAEGTALQNVNATVSLPSYTPGLPVVIGRAKGHPKPEMEALMRKLYQVSDQLGALSEKQSKLYQETPTPKTRKKCA